MTKVFMTLLLVIFVLPAQAGLVLFINQDDGIAVQSAETDTDDPIFRVVSGLDLNCLGEAPDPGAAFILDIDSETDFFGITEVAIERDVVLGNTNIRVTTPLGNLSCEGNVLEEIFFTDGFENPNILE